MRFVTFEYGGKIAPGLMAPDETVIDLSGAGYATLLDLIEAGDDGRMKAENFAAGAKAENKRALKTVKLMAPIPKPRKLLCVGLNYRDHAAETGATIPDVPTIFNKFATAVIGPGDDIVLPKVSKSPDFEAEFAFVIGRGGRHIAKEDWQDHVWATRL